MAKKKEKSKVAVIGADIPTWKEKPEVKPNKHNRQWTQETLKGQRKK